MDIIVNGDPEGAASVTFWSPKLRPATKLSTGATGLVRYGFNQHAWSWSKARYDMLGAKAMRIGGASYDRFLAFNAYPGPAFTSTNTNYNAILQNTVNGACADGFDVVVAITNPKFTAAGDARWPEFCAAVATANLANVERVVLEIGNEPNYNVITGTQYAAMFLAASAAIRAVSPKFRIAGPTINASYVGSAVNFVNQMMAVPGMAKAFDLGSFHPYYQTPEACFTSDLSAFVNRVDTPAVAAGRTDLEYIADECGYTNAIGVLTDPNAENLGPIGRTTYQNMEVSADYYSRLIPLTRSTRKLRMVTFYALKDEGASTDPAGTNGGVHFGVTDDSGAVLKPAGFVCKDMLPLMHSATGASQFHRDSPTTGNRFVRLDVPGSQALVAWAPGVALRDLIAVHAPQGCTLSVNVAAAPPATLTLTPGLSLVPVNLGRRSIIIKADKPIDFPEFVG